MESGSYPGSSSVVNYESSSSENVDFTCSFISVENENIKVLESKFGRSMDFNDYDLAISDMSYMEAYNFNTYETSSITSTVDIYNLISRTVSTENCISSSLEDIVYSDVPICILTGSRDEEFGKSISISNTYIAIGAPNSGSGEGCVYLYQRDANCGYTLSKVINSPGQKRFGFSVSIDKKNESKMVIGTDHSGSNSVYIYEGSGSSWNVLQSITHNTSSGLIKLQNIDLEVIPLSQSLDRYGYSVDMYDNLVVVGAPNDLVYYEFSGSNRVRQRGSTYVYVNDSSCLESLPQNNTYELFEKLYGDEITFKDNMFGYDVAVDQNKILVGSPKPNFPFSSLYLSESINYFTTDFDENDFGESVYNGQVLLYQYDNITKPLKLLTSNPISYRKLKGECFSAYGSSVDISGQNLVIGSPVPLNNDGHLYTSFYLEDTSTVSQSCDPNLTPMDALMIGVEDGDFDISCTSDPIYGTTPVIFAEEREPVYQIHGKSFIYNINDLLENYHIGNVFYNNNRIIVNNTGSILNELLRNPSDKNKSYLNIKYQSSLSFTENQYICTVEPGEFNISTNRTALSNVNVEYAIFNKESFDFKNLDIILRFINYRLTGKTSEKWWDNMIEGEVEESIFEYYSSNIINYKTENVLTESIICLLENKNFDINNDGKVDFLDGTLLWKYFIKTLSVNNYKSYLTITSKRTEYDDIIKFLDEKSGKSQKDKILPEFFEYNYSSSIDVTGSYLAPYITSVGLYSGADLVAVAKLAHPIKNTGEIPINFAVKWYD